MIRMISAVTNDWAIGIENRLPFNIPEDLRHFKQQTMGCDIIMGRKTFDSLPRKLPGRRHLVITSNPFESDDDMVKYISLDSLPNIQKSSEVYVAGGATIYEQLSHLCEEIILTHVNIVCPEADVFFPKKIMNDYVASETKILVNGLAKVTKYVRVR